jgi:hypothetical protein
MATLQDLARVGWMALLVVATGCSGTCIDDGFGGSVCTSQLTAASEGSDTGVGPAGSDTLVLDDTSGGTIGGSQGGTSLDGTETSTSDTNTSAESDTTQDTSTSDPSEGSSSSGEPPQPFCLDADGDGVADLDSCVDADPDDPPPGHIPPGRVDDCDDADPSVYPGAAANEPALCTVDADGDGWGSAMPPPGADAGTDCNDGDLQVFPGAAASEPALCTVDADGDGWGAAMPPPGADAGTDCDDGSPFTFPGAADAEPAPLDTGCLRDEDDDGWGDDTPPPGVVAGSDCADTVPSLFPGAAADEPQLCTADADGDGWGDWDAPTLDPAADEGSDCDDVDPLVERCALVVTQDGTAAASLDAPLVPTLQALGLTVLLAEDALVTAADADPAVLVVVSETANSPDVAAEFRDVDEAAIVMEGLIWDDMDMAPAGIAIADDFVSIADDTHPIAAGLSGIVVFMLPDPGSGTFRTAPGPGAQIIATRVVVPAHVVVFAFEAGVAMQNGLLAPARRVGFGADVDGGMGANGQLDMDGLAMFGAAASWAID